MGKHHVCNPTGTPKVKNEQGDPPVPLKTQGSRKLSPASVIWVGKPLWCLGKIGLESWLEARPHLEP
ncbi:hypothetical protein E2C01_033505 [Portunus trituberculatus]|uniref:Uncharacterized protein n=1 Tax=Portunus trituberculatus TaxID=210409 RepID=A0A5B7F0A4_PORTR|nr:hypothetical protein [Portunus trituberculatus]